MVAEESWMTPAGSCCEPDIIQCNRSYCFLAEVRGSSPFWISGCTDDEFNGCDQHDIPYNSILLRCQCQSDFCNPIDRIPHCSEDPFNNIATKSPGKKHNMKSVAWANQIKLFSPMILLILALGWHTSANED
uniref:Activin_recp domain-containing protein n=1 Tax=Elaeophora elaphi TaxID=1147741 RepID=A0A0R3RFB6_9BILA